MRKKKKKRKNFSNGNCCLDDGDDELFRERLKQLESYEKKMLLKLAQESNNSDDEIISSSNESSSADDDENLEIIVNYANQNVTSTGIDNGKYHYVDDHTNHHNQEPQQHDHNEEQKKQKNHKSEDADHQTNKLKCPATIWKHLFQFQKTGLKWLWELHKAECGGILGDEMGLGKTVQICAFLASLKYSKVKSFNKNRNNSSNQNGLGPVLIVAPVTLISQWVKEFRIWWPYFKVCVLHDMGSKFQFYDNNNNRNKKTKLQLSSELINETFKSNGILITTYSSLLIYTKELISKKWHYVILDEGHKIRNPDAKITIIAKCFRTPHRLIISGSPIQNNLKELWSLFDFVFPGKLGKLQ